MEKGHKADATECRKIAKQLQGYAWMLHKRGDWVDKKYLNLKEREKACLEIMNQREVDLAQARQAHEQALKELRDMQARMLEFSLCVWMEQTEDALAEILDAFAESIGNVRKMAGVCQRFIAFFADSLRWRPLYEFSADGEERFAFPGKEFHMFQDRIFRVWQCLMSFVAVEEAEKAFDALAELLKSWLSRLFFESQGRDVKFRRRVGRRREKFARALPGDHVLIKNRTGDDMEAMISTDDEVPVTETGFALNIDEGTPLTDGEQYTFEFLMVDAEGEPVTVTQTARWSAS